MARSIPFVLLLCALASCTDDATPEASPPAVAERGLDCVSVCIPGQPCRNLCKLTFDDPGFQIVDGPFTCDSLRPINVCGDGCCDPAESDFKSWQGYCREDCRLRELEVLTIDGQLAISNHDRIAGYIEPGYVSLEAVCR